MQLIPNLLIIPAGLIIGVFVAAPVGPVNVLCIKRAIERGFLGGIAAGLGAVIGDGLIAFVAALGIGAISGAIEDYRIEIQTIGGIASLLLGAKVYLSPPRLDQLGATQAEDARLMDYAWDIPQTFFLTITNPGAVLGLFAMIGIASTFVAVETTVDAITMVASIVAGSLAWWIGLSHLISRVRHKLKPEKLEKMNRVSGILLAAFGAFLLAEVAWDRLL